MCPQDEALKSQADCLKAAVKLLSQREHSRLELQRKLSQRKACQDLDEPDIEAVLDDLEAKHWLSDQRFAEQFVRSRLTRGQGAVKMRYELQQRGVDNDVITIVLAELDVDWIEQAETVRCRKFGASLPQDYKEKMRQSRFLATRGFDAETVQQVVNSD